MRKEERENDGAGEREEEERRGGEGAARPAVSWKS